MLTQRKLEWMEDIGLRLKVVFSSTLECAEWAESRIARGDPAEEIASLKREPGKAMLAWGGAALHVYRPAVAAPFLP